MILFFKVQSILFHYAKQAVRNNGNLKIAIPKAILKNKSKVEVQDIGLEN